MKPSITTSRWLLLTWPNAEKNLLGWLFIGAGALVSLTLIGTPMLAFCKGLGLEGPLAAFPGLILILAGVGGYTTLFCRDGQPLNHPRPPMQSEAAPPQYRRSDSDYLSVLPSPIQLISKLMTHRPSRLMLIFIGLLISSPSMLRAQSLVDSVESAPLSTIQQQLKASPASINTPDEYGFTPLHRAVSSERPDKLAVVEILLKAGADPNAQSTRAGTVIQHAIAAGDVETVKRLLAAGADLQKPGADEISSLERLAWVQESGKVVALFDIIREKAPDLLTKHGADAYYLCVDRVNPIFSLQLGMGGVKLSAADSQALIAVINERLSTEQDEAIRRDLELIRKIVTPTK